MNLRGVLVPGAPQAAWKEIKSGDGYDTRGVLVPGAPQAAWKEIKSGDGYDTLAGRWR